MRTDIKALRRAIGKSMLVDVGDLTADYRAAVHRVLIGEIAMTTLLDREGSKMHTMDDTDASSSAETMLPILNAIATGERMVGRSLQLSLESYLALAQRIANVMA